MENDNTYNYTLDKIRMIAALSIVVLHLSAGNNSVIRCINALTRFAVPFFFMISGYYSFGLNNLIWKQKILTRIIKLLRLAFIMEIIAAIHYGAVTGLRDILVNWIMPELPLHIRFLRILGGVVGNYGAGWFVYALIVTYILYIVVRSLCIEKLACIGGGILLTIHIILNITVMQSISSDIYVSNTFFMGLPCFWVGYMIKPYVDNNRNNQNIRRFLCMVLICSIIYSGFYGIYFESDLNLGAIAIAGSLLALSQLKGAKETVSVFSDFLSISGRKYSSYIYILHLYAIEMVDHTFEITDARGLSLDAMLIRMLSVIFIVIVVCLVCYVFDKYVIKLYKDC